MVHSVHSSNLVAQFWQVLLISRYLLVMQSQEVPFRPKPPAVSQVLQVIEVQEVQPLGQTVQGDPEK